MGCTGWGDWGALRLTAGLPLAGPRPPACPCRPVLGCPVSILIIEVTHGCCLPVSGNQVGLSTFTPQVCPALAWKFLLTTVSQYFQRDWTVESPSLGRWKLPSCPQGVLGPAQSRLMWSTCSARWRAPPVCVGPELCPGLSACPDWCQSPQWVGTPAPRGGTCQPLQAAQRSRASF